MEATFSNLLHLILLLLHRLGILAAPLVIYLEKSTFGIRLSTTAEQPTLVKQAGHFVPPISFMLAGKPDFRTETFQGKLLPGSRKVVLLL